MSTSEKPAKKAAKKTPAKKAAPKKAVAKKAPAKKAPAKKAVAAPPTTVEEVLADLPSPEIQEILERVDATLQRAIANARERGIPALTGECSVTLKVSIQDMATPIHAVDEMIYQLLNNGMRSYAFIVEDSNTGETYVVHDGEIVDAPD